MEDTGTAAVWLRTYDLSDVKCSVCQYGYHQSMIRIGDVTRVIDSDERQSFDYHQYDDDPRWPSTAECGYVFDERAIRSPLLRQLYKLPDGTITTIEDAPIGVCWDLPMFERKGPDGRHLVVKCPIRGGHWHIDERASNCTMPDDDVHRCWVRHGRPEDRTLHVDKMGVTCHAGAGSIQTSDWHGFLTHGKLQSNR